MLCQSTIDFQLLREMANFLSSEILITVGLYTLSLHSIAFSLKGTSGVVLVC